MEVWFIMLGCNLIFPAIMLIGGRLFMKNKQGKINYLLGYRTALSMKNEDTWRFAHAVSGRFMWRIGWVSLALAIVPMLFVLGQSEDVIATVGTIVTCLELVPILLAIPYTERALRKTFDKDGNRK